MAATSKNARVGSGTQGFFCSCGGAIRMLSRFSNGKMKHLAECEKCKKQARRPSDFS